MFDSHMLPGTAGMLRSLRWLQRFNLCALRQPIMAEHFPLIIFPLKPHVEWENHWKTIGK